MKTKIAELNRELEYEFIFRRLINLDLVKHKIEVEDSVS